jgi:hypothetical protein
MAAAGARTNESAGLAAGTRMGEPVAVQITIELTFTLR